MTTSPFVLNDGRNPTASVRLFCFAYAGAGGSCFRRLQARLRAQVDVVRVQLPGREERLGEPAYEELSPLVDALTLELEPLVRGRSVFLGYSLGALLAFEAARALQRGARPLQQLVACASPAPCTLEPTPPAADDDDTLLGRLRELGATPPPLLADRSTMQVLLPAIRADFRPLDRYRYEPGPALRCGIRAIGGERDDMVERRALESWRLHTSARCDVSFVPGGHFFMHESAEPFHDLVLATLGVAQERESPQPWYSET